jgi:hypothetical protein
MVFNGESSGVGSDKGIWVSGWRFFSFMDLFMCTKVWFFKEVRMYESCECVIMDFERKFIKRRARVSPVEDLDVIECTRYLFLV